MASTDSPVRGEIWLVALGAARPGEPGKTRPALVLTPEELLVGSPADLVTVVPISTTVPASHLNPPIDGDGALEAPSVAVVRAVRSVARKRLMRQLGEATKSEVHLVDQALLVSLGIVRPG